MGLRRKVCLQLILIFCLKQDLHVVDAGRTFHKTGSTLADVNMMFEFLLGGVEIDQDNNIVLHDKELASMRSGRAFLSNINDGIPKTPASMAQMMSTFENMRRPLTPSQFDSVVMSMVYSAHQAWHQHKEEQQAWAEVLLQLANVTVNQLRGQYLINYAKK